MSLVHGGEAALSYKLHYGKSGLRHTAAHSRFECIHQLCAIDPPHLAGRSAFRGAKLCAGRMPADRRFRASIGAGWEIRNERESRARGGHPPPAVWRAYMYPPINIFFFSQRRGDW
jgi:hypothetical protein